MATVSHNAMRRYPINGSTDGNQSSQHYYVASSQQLSPKKTWTQRLRISKSEKSSAKSPTTDISSELSGSSTLSRSMKYAEPWLYGTVRGIPARPVHHNGQAIFTPIPAEVAVVVCSCPEYLTGTKREIKKASICKKCKGSRLPLAPIGGTVRITSTTAVPLLHKSRSSAGTMRLPMTTSGSVKSRPSILDPQNDPYDLMRRTRLLSPEAKSLSKSSDKSIRNRAKSTSPTRGRSRSRLKPAPPPPTPLAPPPSSLHVMDEVLPSVKNNRNKNTATNKQQDCWFDTLEPEPGGRRSILHCNVNPYDLISSNTSTHHMNEFSPNNDDDDIFGSSHHYRITGTISKSIGKTLNYSNVKAIAGQRISLGDEKTTKSTSSLITQICENFKYENSASCSKKGISESNEMENTKLKHSKPQQQQQIQQQSQHRHTQLHGVVNEKVVKKDGGSLVDVKQQPKRPPRRKHDTNGIVADEDNEVLLSTATSTKMTNECNGTIIEGQSVPSSSSPSSISLSLKPSSSSASTLKPQIPLDSSLVTSQRQGGIKSILKRPSSLTSPSSSSLSSSVSTSSAAINVGNLEKNNTKNYLSDTIARNDAHTNSFNSDKTSSISTNVKGDTTKCNDKTSTSQFYLPLPQPTRKKVQFMVEDKIILDESDENKILEENENNMTKILTKTIQTKTAPAITSKIIMGHNGQDRISSIKQQQDKQQEILELLQKEKKTDKEVIVGSNSNRIKDDYIRGMNKNNENCYMSENNNSFNLNETQIESSSKLMVNGKPTILSSSSSLSNGKMKSYKSTSFDDENCVLIIKKEEDTNDGKEHQQLFFKRKELQDKEKEEREEHQNDEDDDLKVQSSSSSSISRKQQSSLRRTLSDRRSNTTTIILNFNDTMALRAKNTRMDSRELFIEDDQQQQSKQQLLYYSDEEVHKKENKINQNDTKKDVDSNCKDLKEHQKEKQQPLQKYQTQQSVLKPKNEFLPEIMSKTTIAQIKVINDEISLENRLKDSHSFSSSTSSILRKQNELHTISAQQQQMVEKPQNSKSFKQQHHQEQQSSGKRISWQEDVAITIKNDSNISSSWDKENNVNKNVENICENSNNMQQRNDLNHITEQNKNESISVISENANNNKSISNNNNDSNNSKIKLKDQENLNYQFQEFKNLTEHKDMEIGRNNEGKLKIHEIEKEKFLQAQNEIYNGARLFGNSQQQQQQQQQYHHQNSTIYNKLSSNNSSPSSPSVPQKTVVRVAPFNKTSSEIHRLKIQHHDVDNHTDDNIISQKKTSILINGDDCYSTVNVNNDTPIYQSSVVVTDGPKNTTPPLSSLSSSTSISSFTPSSSISLTGAENLGITTTNTVTISVSNNIKSRTPEEDIIYKNNKINTLLSQNVTKSVIPIVKDEKNISENVMMMTTATTTMTTNLRNDNSNNSNLANRVRTLITLDYGDDGTGDAMGDSNGRGCAEINKNESKNDGNIKEYNDNRNISNNVFSHEEELVKILRNPVEAVKRNLVPHVCGKSENTERGNVKNQSITSRTSNNENSGGVGGDTITNTSLKQDKSSFIGKLLQDSTLSQLAEGLDSDVVAKLIENSLKRLKDSRNNVDTSGTKDNDDMTKLIDTCLHKIKEERHKLVDTNPGGHNIINNKKSDEAIAEEQESQSNRGSISSGNSYSSANYELFDFENNESDCYQSCSSEITADEDTNPTRNKFYQMLVDATLSEIEITTNNDDDHHYESIRINNDPIYEEISEVPPPLPLSPPPINDPDFDKKNARSMFEGASKYDILSYLVDAKERGLVREESYEYNFSNTSDIIVEEEMSDTLSDLNKRQQTDTNSRMSHLSITSDSSEDTSLTNSFNDKLQLTNTTGTTLITQQQQQQQQRKTTSDIERNDSGVGSETSKSSRSKYQSQSLSLSSSSSQLSGINGNCSILDKNSPIHLCEDCDGPVETQITDSGVMYAPLVCRKCGKKRAERKEIITEIVETEEKYGRDLQIILEEFCQPMFVAGLLTQEQLSAIFLNTEELLENNQALAERMRDALDIALEQGDDDLLTVNVGKIFLECTQMLHAFESYCIRQAGASLLLANLEKEKELLRIFLRVSQMENTVLRRMNLNSFLMVPVQRVTKYPLLLARLYKVTPQHLEGRELLKQAQEKIELHLNHMNQEAKDVPTKLWRRISSSSPNRRASCEIDMINIKLRKMSIDVLEWNHDEVRFAMEGKLLFTQPTDSNWKKGRTIKLTPVNALLVTNGKPSTNYKAEKALSDQLNFPKHTGIREAALLLVKEKCGRYTLIREPLYLDRCVICTETDWDDYFEVHEISSKDTFIFKAEDGVRSKQWYTQLQYHAQGMGTWRKRRNALANIMINGMLSRT